MKFNMTKKHDLRNKKYMYLYYRCTASYKSVKTFLRLIQVKKKSLEIISHNIIINLSSFIFFNLIGKTVQELHFLLYTLCCCNIVEECKSMLLQMAYSKENSKLPCLPRNSQPFMTPLIIRMTLHPLQCKCQVSTIAFQLCCTFGLSSNKTLKIFKVQNSI